jgi:hypothetical protein
VAGAILIDDYKQGLFEAGFEHAEIVDTKRDLMVYDKLDSQEASCAPATELPVATTSCCAPNEKGARRDRLSELLSRYSVNDYAASVRVYAVKPRQ